MPCKHAALAAIYAQQMAEMDEPWKLWQSRGLGCAMWITFVSPFAFLDTREYRQISKTIRIGNYDVPEPIREKPARLTPYWYIAASTDAGVIDTYWSDDSNDMNRLKRGHCHLSEENAIIHAKALFSFSEIRGE